MGGSAAVAVIAIFAVILAGAPLSTTSAAPPAPAAQGKELSVTFSLASVAFKPGGEIPRQFTCQGKDTSPPLSWSGVPQGTRTLALILEDPDAPDPAAPKMTWVHWVLYNIPTTAHQLKAAVTARELPAGAKEGLNDWKRTGYGGPCPPIGRHRYFHRIYALDTLLEFKQPPGRAELLKAMEGHILAEAELMGTYQKSK